uniref:Copper transport protein n=1 Tax=Caenorhabditis japonica TaxID=281687 RepID=A0A8R1DG58_CAEJA
MEHGSMDMKMDMDMNKPPFMWMWFHTKPQDTVLFSTWNITSAGTMVWACCLIVIAGILLELIKYTRRLIQKQKPAGKDSTYLSRLFSTTHFVQTVLFLVQLAFSYCLMLIFMTFSIWLGLAVVVGLAIGFLIFGGKSE